MDTRAQPRHDTAAAAPSPSEVHNAAVDEDAAGQGGCAQVHLPTGGMCTLRHRHEGSCEFSPPGQADALLTERRAAEGW